MEQNDAAAAVIFGVSGSGKTLIGTRLATTLGWTFIDADDLHPADNVRKMRQGLPLDDADRWPWLDILRARVLDNLRQGCSTVLACSALKQAYRERLAVDARVRFFYLRVQREVLMERLRHRRGHFFNPVLLESQLQTLEPPGADETVDAGATPDKVVREIRRRLHVSESRPIPPS